MSLDDTLAAKRRQLKALEQDVYEGRNRARAWMRLVPIAWAERHPFATLLLAILLLPAGAWQAVQWAAAVLRWVF